MRLTINWRSCSGAAALVKIVFTASSALTGFSQHVPSSVSGKSARMPEGAITCMQCLGDRKREFRNIDKARNSAKTFIARTIHTGEMNSKTIDFRPIWGRQVARDGQRAVTSTCLRSWNKVIACQASEGHLYQKRSLQAIKETQENKRRMEDAR